MYNRMCFQKIFFAESVLKSKKIIELSGLTLLGLPVLNFLNQLNRAHLSFLINP